MIMLLSLLFSIVLSSFISLLVGTSAIFLDVPSFIFIIIPTAFFIYITNIYKNIWKYLKFSFKKNYQFNKDELEYLVHDLGAVIKILLASGAFSFFAAIIAMLHNLDDPASIGPYLAVSLLSELYAIALSFFVIYPTKVWAETKLRDSI